MVSKHIRDILKSKLTVRTVREQVGGNSSLANDLRFDSSKLVRVLAVVNAQFDIPIDDDDLSVGLFNAVHTLVDHMARKVGAA